MICSLVMLFFFLYKENQYLNPTFPQEKKSTSNYCNNRIIKKKKKFKVPITWFGSIKMLIILILKKKFKKMLIILGLE